MNESSATSQLNAKLRKRGIHVWKINTRFAKGVPDCWYSGPGGDLWAEVKWLHSPPKDGRIPNKLSAMQCKWLKERAHEGRNVALIVLWPKGGTIIKNPCDNVMSYFMQTTTYTVEQLAEIITKEVSHDKDRRPPKKPP